MPKFAPNTGFKMPGVGSRNIDSPGNFRDEQHVDKVGYCDTTEESMLPAGSSPLKKVGQSYLLGPNETLKGFTIPKGKTKSAAQDGPQDPPEDLEQEIVKEVKEVKTNVKSGSGKTPDFNSSYKPESLEGSTKIDPRGVSKAKGNPPKTKKSNSGGGTYTDSMAYKNLGAEGQSKYGSEKAFSKSAQAYRDKRGTGTNVAKKGGLRDAAKSTSGTAGAKTGQKVSDAAEKLKDGAKKLFGG